MSKKENLLELNHSCYGMLNHCEAKTSILIAVDLGLIAAILGVYGSNNFFVDNIKNPFYIVFTTYFGLIVLASLISIVISSFALISRFSSPGEEHNIFYFNDVSTIGIEKYRTLLNQDEKLIEEQLAKENIALSKILKKKYYIFNIALRFIVYPLGFFVPGLVEIIIYIVKQ